MSKLCKNVTVKREIELILFSHLSMATLLADAEHERIPLVENRTLLYKLRLADEFRLACYDLFFEHPFMQNGKKDTSILVIGTEHFGKEIVKAMPYLP